MALGATSIVRTSGEDYDPDTEGPLRKGSEARVQIDQIMAERGEQPPQEGRQWTMTDTAIASLQDKLVIKTNSEIFVMMTEEPDPVMLWTDMQALDDEPDE